MPEPIDTTILDPDTLARMDEEFLAGKYGALAVPPAEPLDPKSDPFGMEYQWLDPADSFADVYADVATRFPSDLYRNAAGTFRQSNLSGSFASGTNEEVFESWVGGGFLSLCRAAGGDLLDRIRQAAGPSAELTREVARLLQRLPGFDELEPAQQVSVAFTVTDSVRKHLNPASAARPNPAG